MSKWGHSKLKTFGTAKEANNRRKREPAEWEKEICRSSVWWGGLMSKTGGTQHNSIAKKKKKKYD